MNMIALVWRPPVELPQTSPPAFWTWFIENPRLAQPPQLRARESRLTETSSRVSLEIQSFAK